MKINVSSRFRVIRNSIITTFIAGDTLHTSATGTNIFILRLFLSVCAPLYNRRGIESMSTTIKWPLEILRLLWHSIYNLSVICYDYDILFHIKFAYIHIILHWVGPSIVSWNICLKNRWMHTCPKRLTRCSWLESYRYNTMASQSVLK